MTDKIAILQNAADTGEVLRIKYHGGSRPGSIRNIIVQKILENKINASFKNSNHVIAFTIDKIEIVPADYKQENEIPVKPQQVSVIDVHKDEKREQLVGVLQNATSTGEVLKIKYHGGSRPGSVREIVVQRILENKIYAYCLISKTVKAFVIDKIELASGDEDLTENKKD